MSRPKTIIIFLLNLLSAPVFATRNTPVPDTLFYNGVSRWFSAWELVSRNIYHLNKSYPAEFVFFDDRFVYSTSAVTVANGDFVKGPKLLNHSFVWRRALHNDSITLPDKSRVKIGLMSFASELHGEKSTSFFVMPLPQFWRNAGVTSQELGTENLITGIFLHEFSHSQQMQNFGKEITELERHSNFGTDFSDDLVQHLFEKDTGYTSMYRLEVSAFYKAVSETDKRAKYSGIKAGLELLQNRHNKFFSTGYKSLKNIDAFFLTMEGLGQYTMYAWLVHKKGANLQPDTAIGGVRRGKKRWSQDEGFALFLLLAQLSEPKNWAMQMFGDKTESVITLINRQLHKKSDSG